MTEVQKMQNEIDALSRKSRKVVSENSVSCDKAIKRTYTYRKHTAITAGDVRSL